MQKISKVAGRVAVHTPTHPHANNRGYVLRARWVVEQSLGRYLSTEEHVHHVNGDPTDDRIENLRVVTPHQHVHIHKPFEHHRRKLDYQRIAELMAEGYGYRRIARQMGESAYSVKYAVGTIRRGL